MYHLSFVILGGIFSIPTFFSHGLKTTNFFTFFILYYFFITIICIFYIFFLPWRRDAGKNARWNLNSGQFFQILRLIKIIFKFIITEVFIILSLFNYNLWNVTWNTNITNYYYNIAKFLIADIVLSRCVCLMKYQYKKLYL